MKTLALLYVLTSLSLVACGDASGLGDNNTNENNNSNHDPVCGDGHLDPGELCDDGSANSDSQPDACRSNCYLPGCGDGVADSDEACDGTDLAGEDCTSLGQPEGTLACDPTCAWDISGCDGSAPVCGDGVVEGDEACDDGTANSDTLPDSCRADCTLPSCGDDVADSTEDCDGSDLASSSCTSLGLPSGVLLCGPTCAWNISGCTGGTGVCGNGVVEPGEQCDDGNLTGCDGCSPTCIVEECGNGVIECNEGCDDANSSNLDGCLNDCTTNTCGDGYVYQGVEECDDGNHGLNDSCPDGPQGSCLFASCGDGYLQAGVEGCDDGNGDNSDGCPTGPGGTCEPAYCGDGFVQTGVEQCEFSLDPTCQNSCQSFCGDGVIDSGELCDDPYSCSADCQRYCGDGVVDTDLGEVCDERWTEDPFDPMEGPLGGNLSGAATLTCLANCQPSFCGDGICHSVGENDKWTCAQDCNCAQWGLLQCTPGCCVSSETCCNPGCTTQFSSVPGVQNCGTCGNNCTPSEACINGNCV